MIYVTGDMHGDIERLYDSGFKQLKEGDTLIVAGDFGFLWDGSKAEKKIIKYLGSRKYTICFLDGAHDDLKKLAKYRKTVYKGGVVHRIYKNLFHMCRGQIFTIDGINIFTFGGGESDDMDNTDIEDLLPNGNEMKEADENLQNCSDTVDYIITHEPPARIKDALRLKAQKTPITNVLNAYFEELNSRCTYRKWFFGSVHMDKEITPRHRAVYTEYIPLEGSELYRGSVTPVRDEDFSDFEDCKLSSNNTERIEEDEQ